MVTRKSVYTILILIVVRALIGVLLLHFRLSSTTPNDTQYVPHDEVVSVGEIRIPVTVADTEEERNHGLSGTLSLSKGTGKLFIFDTPGIYGFWMKDMSYGLDLVWIDASLRVVGVTSNVMPESFPEVFYAPSEVLYVLEVNRGEAPTLGLTEGVMLSR